MPVLIEFVNTCPSCEEHERTVREVAARYGDKVELRVYQAGKDMDYVAKYGPVMRGTLFVGEQVRVEALSRSAIERAIAKAVAESES